MPLARAKPATGPNNRIRDFREIAPKISLQALAAAVPMSYQTLQRWETRGRLSVDEIKPIAEAFRSLGRNVSVEQLLPDEVVLSPAERALLQRYRNATDIDRRAIERAVRGLTDHLDLTGDEAFDRRRHAGTK